MKQNVKLSALETAVLAVLRDHKKGSLNNIQIWRRVTLNSDIGKDRVYKALLSLASKKRIQQVSKGHFKYIHPLKQVVGYIQFNRSGDAYVVGGDKNSDEPDIFIPGEFLYNALPGDLVSVETIPGKRKNVARVIQVEERSKTPVTGTLDIFETDSFLIPDKITFPFEVRLKAPIDPKFNGFKASVKIIDFPENSSNPVGTIIEILGKQGTNDAEMHSIVAEFGFRVSFTENVLKETEAIADEVQQGAAWPERRDFRDIFTITIDPADAKDFDDAISLRVNENGHYEVGVHIADVSHYVLPGSALDQEALARGTSVYLVDRTIPMLPEKLSNDLCSLKPNTDRLSFSVLVTLNQFAEVVDVWYGKSVIHSDKRFSYEDAQEIIAGGKGDFHKELATLNSLAKKLHTKRTNEGSISFESDEIKFRLNENGKPTGVFLKKRFDAHKLIEEFMLLANQLVAKHIKTELKPEKPFIYRSHDSPAPDKLLDFVKFCKQLGYVIDTSTDHRLRKTMNDMLESIHGKPEEDVLSQAAIRSMAKAIYTGKRSDHFGLAFSYYTHFTSPIRRYPDLLAHRMLFNYLNGKGDMYNEAEIEKIAVHSSNTEQKAAEAERASVKYKMAEYMQGFKGRVFEAVVSGVTAWGIYAEIIENHCEGFIRLSELNGDHFVFIEQERKVKGLRTGRSFAAGNVISIRVKGADPQKRQIDFYLEE